MRVSTAELRAISTILFDHLDHLGVSSVEIDVDYYWHVPYNEVYDPSLAVLHPDIGQLSEDWERLALIREGTAPPVADALAWLAAILRATGEQVAG